MLTWILIIFALAMVFGIIKIENLKEWYAKAVEIIQANLNKNKTEEKKEVKVNSQDENKAE